MAVKWLAIAALPLVTATAAHAEFKGLAPADVAELARTRTLDFRLLQQHGVDREPLLIDGMIAKRGVAPNAFVGFGLAHMYSRKRRGDSRISEQPSARKPAVTFVLKF
jgi:hypothetical protein